ncbi:spondin domain-containing protein [soil metagenome]
MPHDVAPTEGTRPDLTMFDPEAGMRRMMLLCTAVALSAAACADDPTTTDDALFSFGVQGNLYEVTVENLTAGQPFTPPLIATHRPSTRMFSVGQAASLGVQEIAENGNLAPLMAALQADRHVADFAALFGPTVPPVLGGESVTGQLRANLGATRLSWVSMLVCTNDGFTGSNSVRLPLHLGESIMLYTNGYDAGTEINTESFDDLVPPCGPLTGVDSQGRGTGESNPALAEGGVIHHHPGIHGNADLIPAIHGWIDPVARVTITRVE